ncbi:MAG: hypothetical protein Q9227_006570 [Pyrenula ochraceoflavens]
MSLIHSSTAWTPSSSSSSSSGGDSHYSHSSENQHPPTLNLIIAHATLSTTCWTLLIPLGALLLRILPSNLRLPFTPFRIHTVIQTLALLSFLAGLTTGILAANRVKAFFDVWHDPHIIIGLIVFGAAALMPLMGTIHHAIFKSHRAATGKASPTPWGTTHRWLGRVLLLLGIINAGLGFRLSLDSPTQNHDLVRVGILVYSCVSVAMVVLYGFVAIKSEFRRYSSSSSSSQRTEVDETASQTPSQRVRGQRTERWLEKGMLNISPPQPLQTQTQTQTQQLPHHHQQQQQHQYSYRNNSLDNNNNNSRQILTYVGLEERKNSPASLASPESPRFNFHGKALGSPRLAPRPGPQQKGGRGHGHGYGDERRG